jgi:hypothetical protein
LLRTKHLFCRLLCPTPLCSPFHPRTQVVRRCIDRISDLVSKPQAAIEPGCPHPDRFFEAFSKFFAAARRILFTAARLPGHLSKFGAVLTPIPASEQS